MGPTKFALLKKVLDPIESLRILDDQTSVYDKIRWKADDREIYIPPTTHLVAMVEDLTDVLDYASDEATDMDEDVGDLPGAPTSNTNN